LKVIGEEKREQVIDDEAGFILDDGKTDYTDIKFLIDVKKFDEAEICILVMAGTQTLNGRPTVRKSPEGSHAFPYP